MRRDNSPPDALADADFMRHNAATSSRATGRRGVSPLTVSLPSFRPIVVIPARMAATRLPGKPLADIAGEPMIVHVLRRAEAAAIGPVLVACAEAEIKAAVERVDPERRHDIVVNLQGDWPLVDPGLIRAVLAPLAEPQVDIATLACRIREEAERDNPNVVKVAVGFAEGQRIARALYFSRLPVPHGAGEHYHHVGIYAYRRAALERF